MMGKYLDAISGNKPSGYELPKLTEPIRGGFDSFDSAKEGDIYPQKYQLEKLEECPHGRQCKNLVSLPPARPLCKISGEPVFDLPECPAGKWKSWTDGAVMEIILMPAMVGRGVDFN